MPDLETLLRDVRPAPEPAWAAQLDARVAAGFPGPPARWKAPFATLRANLLALGTAGSVAAIVVVLIVAAIHSGGATSTEGNQSTAAAARPSGGEDSATGAGASLSAPTAIAPVGQAPRSVRSSASLTLACPPAQVATVTDRAIRVVDSVDGFV